MAVSKLEPGTCLKVSILFVLRSGGIDGVVSRGLETQEAWLTRSTPQIFSGSSGKALIWTNFLCHDWARTLLFRLPRMLVSSWPPVPILCRNGCDIEPTLSLMVSLVEYDPTASYLDGMSGCMLGIMAQHTLPFEHGDVTKRLQRKQGCLRATSNNATALVTIASLHTFFQGRLNSPAYLKHAMSCARNRLVLLPSQTLGH